jgi:hypothetical protein
MTDKSIPEGFTDAFLDWFRTRTEATWATYQPETFEDYVAAHVGGTDWQPGTRWLGGLSEAEIERVEHRWSLRFPPDYRRFLGRLHALDQPMRGARFSEVVDDGRAIDRMVSWERPALYNWLIDEEALQSQWDWLVDGLQFDVEHNDLWPPSWGPKPATALAQKARVGELVAAAPRLLPVFLHRYLLAEPGVEGNPVFSMYQSDIIVYGPDLRSYFLVEFADLLGIDRQAARREADEVTNARSATYTTIPFWGELWLGD